jgi:hypothetical protein
MTATAKAIQIKIPKPHPAQKKIMDAEGRFNVVVCGRRFGKTRMALLRSLKPILTGKPIAYFAPTYKMLTEFWREAIELYKPVITEQNKAEHWFKVMGGGSFQMWSLDSADTVRGRKYALALIDEAAMVPNLQDAWNAVIRPTLTDYEGGADFYSTPKGLNFFYTLFTFGQDDEKPDWHSFQLPTSANPFIKQSEIDSAALDLPQDVFKQEYLAEFIQGEGAVFRNILANLYDGKDETPEKHKGHTMLAGVDWGRVNDFTVISIACEQCKREVAMDRFNRIDWEFQRQRLVSLCDKWGVSFALLEENSFGSPNIEVMQKSGNRKYMGFLTTAQSKPPLILSLALCLEQEEMKWLDVPIATRELEAYEAKRNEVTNRIQYSAPEGFHDDTVIARCLVREAIEQRKRNTWTQGTRQIR